MYPEADLVSSRYQLQPQIEASKEDSDDDLPFENDESFQLKTNSS